MSKTYTSKGCLINRFKMALERKDPIDAAVKFSDALRDASATNTCGLIVSFKETGPEARGGAEVSIELVQQAFALLEQNAEVECDWVIKDGLPVATALRPALVTA